MLDIGHPEKKLYFGSVFDHQCRPLELGFTCIADIVSAHV